MTGLDGGVAGLRIGVLDEGFIDAEPDVADLVLAAVAVLESAGATVSKVSVPAHLTVRSAHAALGAEGSKAVFDTGFMGAWARTYYPASLIAAVNDLWAHHADLLNPRTKLNLMLTELSRRNFSGRVYAKAQNVRPTFIAAYEAALADVDVLVLPTCLMKAPRYEAPATEEETLLQGILGSGRAVVNTSPFNYTGFPALAVPCGKSGGLPVSMQLVGRFFDDPLLLRVAYAYQQSVDWDATIRVGA